MKLDWKIIGGAIAVVLVAALVLWLLLFHSSQTTPQSSTGGFGFVNGVSNVQTSGATNVGQTGAISGQKVFEISAGPVASATFMQTYAPTTTVARYVMADNGHVLDLNIDVPGAVARPVSNTTIPGIVSGTWGRNGSSTVLQYVDAGTLKSVYMEFASTSAGTTATPTRIQFLPDNILSLAVSPDGSKLTYLLKTNSGSDGYIANIDGSSATKLFSLPLSQVFVSWPATTTLLVQTKSAAGVPGIAFSASVKTGVLTPLLYTPGLSAIANNTFSKIVYQTVAQVGGIHQAYAHDTQSGQDLDLPFNPFPEKCVWSAVSNTTLYCAAPAAYVSGDYLDQWHQGLVTTPDSIFEFDVFAGATSLVVAPGSGNTAPAEPINSMAVSSDGRYLLFITRGDQSLWGVRL